MKFLFFISCCLIYSFQTESMVIFDFDKSADISNWRIMDDVVMGGRSQGNFEMSAEGHGKFYGDVSLENYGGFSSVRYTFEQRNIEGFTKCKLRLKGDGKVYQFRMKNDYRQQESYVLNFQTSGEWEDIEITLSDLTPTFRGRKLRRPNFKADLLQQIAILIANKKNESFELEIDSVELY